MTSNNRAAGADPGELKAMTQAELAGGAIDASQARPAKGQLIREFTLTSTLGQEISISDYRGRSNLVLVFAAGGVGNPDFKILAEIAADHNRFQDEQTQVVAIMQCTQEKAARIKQEANLPFPLLVDADGRIHRSAGATDKSGHPTTAIYITDRFGEVFAVYRVAEGQTKPSAQEIIKWLTFINIQCPECGHPEWPA
jgi:mycoredoxin-dependent peroxiredoxin